MTNLDLSQLARFLDNASKATYAGGGGQAKAQRLGFTELEYREGDWYYRDSYTGYLRSWGEEVAYRKDEPVWTCLYGGGMEPDYMNKDFASKTFGFLKQALSAGEKPKQFQPRGPKKFRDGDWSYSCILEGDITKFKGSEEIRHKDIVVFTHDFVGGLVLK